LSQLTLVVGQIDGEAALNSILPSRPGMKKKILCLMEHSRGALKAGLLGLWYLFYAASRLVSEEFVASVEQALLLR
jgi:hypothetical protein